MTPLWIALSTVDICVMLLIVAAAVLAMAIRPGTVAPVQTYLYACDIYPAPAMPAQQDDAVEAIVPMLRMEVLDDLRVVLTRTGFADMLTDHGAVSIAINVKGSDITIEERITPGNGFYLNEPVTATTYIDCLRPSSRPLHIYYRSSALSREAALSLAIAPGISLSRQLTQ
jgi:hypothetical protein